MDEKEKAKQAVEEAKRHNEKIDALKKFDFLNWYNLILDFGIVFFCVTKFLGINKAVVHFFVSVSGTPESSIDYSFDYVSMFVIYLLFSNDLVKHRLNALRKVFK